VRRLAPGVPFGEGLKLTAETMTAMPPDKIGRMMSGVEAVERPELCRRRAVRHGGRFHYSANVGWTCRVEAEQESISLLWAADHLIERETAKNTPGKSQ